MNEVVDLIGKLPAGVSFAGDISVAPGTDQRFASVPRSLRSVPPSTPTGSPISPNQRANANPSNEALLWPPIGEARRPSSLAPAIP
jgi:hypothetical protein